MYCVICISSQFTLLILYITLQHEKFTSGLQLGKKPPNGETTTNTSTGKSPAKTPTKTARSPSSTTKSVESRVTDAVTSSRDSSAKPVDSHKAEEKMGGEITNKREM